jgi:hypothetical protein
MGFRRQRETRQSPPPEVATWFSGMSWLPATPVKEATATLAEQIRQEVGDPTIDPRLNARCMTQALLCFYTGTLMQPTYSRLFAGMSEIQLDEILASFSLAKCRPNERLVATMKKYMAGPA